MTMTAPEASTASRAGAPAAGWRTVCLGEVCRIVSGSTPRSDVQDFWDGEIAWVTPADMGRITDGRITSTARRLTKAGYQRCSTVLVPAGSVVISSRAPIGHVAIAEIPLCTNQGCKTLVPGPLVKSRFLYHAMRRAVPALQALGTGATFAEVSKSQFERFHIDLPDLPTQHRIVAILDEAAELQRLRREADCRTAELAPAIFDEMFGDPAANPNGWQTAPLRDLVRFVGGDTPSRNRPEFFDGTIPWATSKDMKTNFLGDTKEHITEEAIQSSATNLVPPGSVLVVVKSKILARTLPVAIADVPICFGQDLKAIICRERLASQYLASLLRGSAKAIIAQARGLNTEGLTLDILGGVSAAVPPLALQREFARRVEQLRAIGARQAESGERLEGLSRSLLERAFRGGLR